MSSPSPRIALLRRIDGLFSLEIVETDDEPPKFHERLRRVTESDRNYEDVYAAWQQLAAVREIQPPVLAAVRLVLAATVRDPEGDRPTLERLAVAPPPAKHTPTAANPRAYQGTKDRPPKPKRPEPRDLRPFLCVPGGQDRLVRLLTEELGDIDLPAEERSAPPGFYRGLAWLAHIMPEHYVGALAAHHALDLERDVELRRLATVFVGSTFGTGISWLRLSAHIDPSLRLPFLLLVRETQCQRIDPLAAQTQLLEVVQRCDEDSFDHRVRYALTMFCDGDDLADVLADFDWADLHNSTHDFVGSGDDHGYLSPADPETRAALQRFVDAFYQQPDREVMRLLRACGLDPALAQELANLTESTLTAKTARQLGQVLAGAVIYDEEGLESWHESRQALRRFVVAASAVDFPGKAIEQLNELVWEGTVEHLDAITRLVPRTCTRPLAEDSALHVAIERLGLLPRDVFEDFVRMPLRSYQVLEAACARRSDAWLISCGFDAFVNHAAAWFAMAFAAHPRTTCKAARTIGLLSWPQRNAIVQQVMASPLVRNAAGASASGLAQLFERHGPKATTSPIPKKLRQHLEGAFEMSPPQLERAEAVVRRAWPAVIADGMQERALAHMAQNLGDGEVDLAELNEQMLHALKLQAGLDSHQRAIRRLLRACHRGDDDYLRQHPRNQAWMQRHQPMSTRWQTGITQMRSLTDGRTVTLAIERDPLEALRLGTYVGSCLGLGGKFTWSAAAVVLDDNKHVVFARDAAGRFLARQVQALTKDGKLANYAVYPTSDAELLQLFADFDRAMAEWLQVEIETDTAEVEELLASEWWDDGVWNLDTSPDEAK